RLGASFAVAGGYINLRRRDVIATCESVVRSYRKWMGRYSRMRVIDIWYDRLDVEQLIEGLPDPNWQKRWRERIARERVHSAIEHEFPKLAARRGQKPQITDNPPLIFHMPENRGQGVSPNSERGASFLPRVAAAAVSRDCGTIQDRRHGDESGRSGQRRNPLHGYAAHG